MNDTRRDTAYTLDEAKEYDTRRFASVGGEAVHRVELGHVQRFLERHCQGPDAAVLEVGCGTGRLLTDVEGSFSLTGLDLSEYMLAEAREALSETNNTKLVSGNAANMSMFDDRSFNLAYSVRLLNRVGTKDVAGQILAETHRVTRQGGFVLIEMTNSIRSHRGKGTVAFRQSEFRSMMNDAGFDVIEVRGAFVLGIGRWTSGNARFLGVARALDATLLRLTPSLGARMYFTARVR